MEKCRMHKKIMIKVRQIISGIFRKIKENILKQKICKC